MRRLSGTASVADLWIEAHDPKSSRSARSGSPSDVENVTVPGVLAKDAAAGRAMTAAIKTVALDTLYARATRTENGIILPNFTGAPAAPASKPSPDAVPPVPVAAPAAKPAGRQPAITIDTITLAKGRVDVTDRNRQALLLDGVRPDRRRAASGALCPRRRSARSSSPRSTRKRGSSR
jgi:hypothetical protein